MEGAPVVSGGEAPRYLERVVEGLPSGQRAFVESIAERLSIEQLLNDVRNPLVTPDVVDGDDVRVAQRAGRSRLHLEAALPVLVPGPLLGQPLDRHVARQPRVTGTVDVAHSAAADRRHDLVGPEPLSR